MDLLIYNSRLSMIIEYGSKKNNFLDHFIMHRYYAFLIFMPNRMWDIVLENSISKLFRLILFYLYISFRVFFISLTQKEKIL